MRVWFVMLLLFMSCSKKAPPQKEPAYPIEMVQVEVKDVPIYIETLGHVDSMTKIEIHSRIEGELTGVYFEQGQEVKKGDLLFSIDPKPYQAALKEAEGALEQAKANLALSEEKVKRYRTLASDEFYSQIDYETLQSEMAANLALVKENEGQLERAKVNLNYCWIYAPIDGMTGILQIDYGNLICVDCEAPLMTLNQMAPIFVTFNIPEFQLPRIQKAKKEGPLKVIVAYEEFQEGEMFEGSLFMLDNQVDPKTGMISLRGVFPNEDRSLWPGQFVRTRLILSHVPHGIVIPFTAVQLTQSGPVVFVVKQNMIVEERKVKLGQRMGDQILVLEGLAPEEKIVLEGQINLVNGSKVFISKRGFK